jgi:hypothetical protein
MRAVVGCSRIAAVPQRPGGLIEPENATDPRRTRAEEATMNAQTVRRATAIVIGLLLLLFLAATVSAHSRERVQAPASTTQQDTRGGGVAKFT